MNLLTLEELVCWAGWVVLSLPSVRGGHTTRLEFGDVQCEFSFGLLGLRQAPLLTDPVLALCLQRLSL